MRDGTSEFLESFCAGCACETPCPEGRVVTDRELQQREAVLLAYGALQAAEMFHPGARLARRALGQAFGIPEPKGRAA